MEQPARCAELVECKVSLWSNLNVKMLVGGLGEQEDPSPLK